jgi:small GTP-binding protein
MSGPEPTSFRVVLVGDSMAGKTSIIHRSVQGDFDLNHTNTVAAVFHTITRDHDGQKKFMQIWDTAGQEKYRSIGPIYYRNAAAAIGVFDVTVDDFEASLDAWIVSVKRTAVDPLIFVVGNKVDLIEEETEQQLIPRIRQFAQKYNAESFFTSAKTGKNIDVLFEAVFLGLIKNEQPPIEIFPPKPNVETEKGGCC